MNAAPPPKISPPDSRQLTQRVALVMGGLTVVGIGVTLYFFNPSKYHFYPVCMFHQMTGLNCPGCGATRAMYALVHGDFLTALHDNALLILLMVAGGGRGLWMAVEKLRGRPAGKFYPAWTLWVVLAAALVFGVVRNLPGFEFLAPL
jgi:hypothetical protein